MNNNNNNKALIYLVRNLSEITKIIILTKPSLVKEAFFKSFFKGLSNKLKVFFPGIIIKRPKVDLSITIGYN